jgi:hypothetical protein
MNFRKRFHVLRVMKMSMLVSWIVMSYGPVGRYQHFGEIYSLQVHMALQPRRPASATQDITYYHKVQIATYCILTVSATFLMKKFPECIVTQNSVGKEG